MASVKIVKKNLPHAIAYQQISDTKTRDAMMKASENEKSLLSQIVNLQNAVLELQKKK